MRRFAAALALVSLMSVASLGVAVAAPAAGPVVGQPAPDFTMRTLGGKTVTLADYRGRTLVINVWGSWCPPCRIETPDLVRAAKAMERDRVAFLGVDTTETPETVRAFVAAKGVPYPQIVTTSDAPFAQDYAIRNYPTTIVIDPWGTVRAIHADNVLPAAQLAAYVDAAKLGRTAVLASEEQAKLDAMLSPDQFVFSGDPAAIAAAVRTAAAAIDKADDELDDAMTDPSRDHDLVRTRGEQAFLRDAAIAAFAPVAASPADKELLARLRGDQLANKGDWAGANTAYADALAIDPKDVAALGGRAQVAQHTNDLATLIAADAAIAQIAPSAGAFVALGRAQARAKMKTESYAAFDHAAELAQNAPAALARTYLYGARSALVLGDQQRAKAQFARAGDAALRIPANTPLRTWEIEQAEEGTIALGLIPGAKPAITLAPWTGPDLPGSIKSTAKFRLVVSGSPNTSVALAADGLPKDWIASFCSDRLCSPFATTVRVPADGVKIVELQIVPRGKPQRRASVRVRATSGGKAVGSASTQVALR
jgi:thiol-disulfide isomerase/thioredoxin